MNPNRNVKSFSQPKKKQRSKQTKSKQKRQNNSNITLPIGALMELLEIPKSQVEIGSDNRLRISGVSCKKPDMSLILQIEMVNTSQLLIESGTEPDKKTDKELHQRNRSTSPTNGTEPDKKGDKE